MQPTWQGNQFQFQRAAAPSIPAFSYVPSETSLSLLATPEVRAGLLASEMQGQGPNQNPEAPSPAAPSPDMLANSLSGAPKAAGLLGPVAGVPGLGIVGVGLASALGKEAMEKSFQDAYGTPGKFSGWDNFVNGVTFGLFGDDFSKQNAANTPGINDSGFASSPPGGHNTQGGRDDRADKDGPQGGNGGGVGNASGEGPGGSAGMGDSEGAASGTWHKGGRISDGDPNTFKDNMPANVQEGEYMIRRSAAQKLEKKFPGLLDYLNRQ